MSGAWVQYTPRNDAIDYVVGFFLFLLICYIFVGIAVASDIFMNAIEKICGSTKTIKTTREEDGVVITDTKQVQVWNDTVANLSLMALGSSAPEILLSAIEISEGLGAQDPGELGPGTIVGSAAYNLLIISAVCILSVPKGGTSRIKIYQVFVVTSITSLFAYIWMVIVLQWSSRDVVEPWEAVVTLLMFPVLVIISYWADQEFCLNGRKRISLDSGVGGEAGRKSVGIASRRFYFGDEQDRLYDDDGNIDKEALQNLYMKLIEVADMTPEEIASILATKLIQGKQHTRMWYRMQASRGLMGGAKLLPVLNEKLQEVVDVINESGTDETVRGSLLKNVVTSPETYKTKAVLDFQAATFAVAESIGKFKIQINRTGKADVGFTVHVESIDGTAKRGKEYQEVRTDIVFEPYIMEKEVEIHVIDNTHWNPDSNFFLRLVIPPEFEEKAVVGQMSVMEIIIEDDDKPGKISFSKRGYIFNDKAKTGYVELERTDGTDGTISVSWSVVPGPKCTLIPEGLCGTLEFKHGEVKKVIEIPFMEHVAGLAEGTEETFDIELGKTEGGAKIGKISKTTCAVSADQKFKLELNNVMNMALEMNEEAEEDLSYKDQIVQAFYVNGGDTKNATKRDWILHILTFPFKFAFSLIPPPHFAGGWLCFVFALLAIGLLTKLVGDCAGTFGQAIGLDPTITAITFVALGTSLPDTFASRIAAINDKTADNAIGNVTGSNSVNVFLGLGVPWTIGAIFYATKNGGAEPFCVPAGSLTFNVVVFTVCAFFSLIILTWRRYSSKCGSAELGGPPTWKWITSVVLILLWIVYIALSSTQVILAKNGKDISDRLTGGKSETYCARLVQRYIDCKGHPTCPEHPDLVPKTIALKNTSNMTLG